MASGWAVCISGGIILVDTVSKTRKASIVNYLFVHRGLFISQAMSDERIEQLWNEVPRAFVGEIYVHKVKVEIDFT